MYVSCSSSGNFGEQELRVSTKSGVGDKYSNTGVPSISYNKYLFSSNVIEGKKIVIFAEQFKMPFGIANIIMAWPSNKKYCFVNPPNEIEDELRNRLQISGINITSDVKECENGSEKVCFSGAGCDVDVNLDAKSVKKNKQNLFYEGNLIYGAIFSDPGIYECQVKRLMKRASEISSIYSAKAESLSQKGCGSLTLIPDIKEYSEKASGIKDSLDLKSINVLSDNLEAENENLDCKLF